jgi:hypothetical protein
VASMPHLSQLQRDYKDELTIIGLTSADKSNTLEKVQEMVQEKGDGMNFTVAWDTERNTNVAYMDAANQRGIPASFLVDKTGNIAWIGHPMNVDIPLAHVVAGTWDYEDGPAMMEEIKNSRRAIGTAVNGNPEKALQLLTAFQRDYPLAAKGMESLEFSILARLPEHVEDATKLGRAMVDKAIAEEDAMALNGFAWNLVDPQVSLENRFLKIALLAADTANELSGEKDGAVLDTVARVHFWMGDLEQAIDIQKRAVEHSKGAMQEALREVLAEYEQALADDQLS